MKSSRLKTILSRLALVGFAFLFSIVLVEIGLRLFVPRYRPFTQADDVLGFSRIPGAYYTHEAPEHCPGWRSAGYVSSMGLRDHEYPYEHPTDTFRILILGDSYAEALEFDLDKTWTKLLEQKLNEAADGKIRYEVINGGRSGMGTGLEYLFYTHEGYKYEPDLVLLLFVPNDLSDNSLALSAKDRPHYLDRPYFKVEDGKMVVDNSFLDSGTYANKKTSYWLRQNLYLSSLATEVYTNVIVPLYQRQAANPTDEDEGEDAPVSETTAEMSPEDQEAVDIARAILVELNREVTEDGAQFVVIHGSAHGQVNWTEQDSWPKEDPPLNFNASNLILRQIAEDEQLTFLDLVPNLQEYSLQNENHVHGCKENEGGGHWSQAGNIVAADTIYQFLIDEELLP